jgi:hypothetical protein
MRVAPMISMLVILSSCQMMEDFPSSTPANKLVAAGYYKDVGACIVRAWNARTNGFYSLMVDESHQKAFIASSSGGTPDVLPDATTVAQINATDVAVEEWKPPTFVGDPGWSWRSVQNCVGTNPTESAQAPRATERIDIQM